MDIEGQGPGRVRLIVLLASTVVLLATTVTAAMAGSLDRSFSGDGLTTVDLGDPNGASAEAVAIGSRGRITAAGDIGGGSEFAVARLLPGGAPDQTFAGDGQIASALGLQSGSAADLALAGNGDTVIGGVGRGRSDLPYGFVLAAFRRGGALDRSFGERGVRVTYLRGLSEIRQIAIDRRGRIVAAGYSSANANYRDSAFAIARYTPRGNLDPSFSGDGKLILRVGGASSQARAIRLDRSGRILVGGVVSTKHGAAFALVRLTERGKLDKTFSRDGEVTAPSFRRCTARCPSGIADLALDHRGHIVAAGDSIIACYTPGGRLDRRFSGNGVASVSDFGAAAVAVDHRGRIVLAGNTGDRLPINFALLRLTARGAPDQSFGNSRDLRIEPRFASASDLAIDKRGRIVAVGRSGGNPSGFAFARYRSG